MANPNKGKKKLKTDTIESVQFVSLSQLKEFVGQILIAPKEVINEKSSARRINEIKSIKREKTQNDIMTDGAGGSRTRECQGG